MSPSPSARQNDLHSAELQGSATDIITANIAFGEKVRTGAPPDDVQKPEENQPRTSKCVEGKISDPENTHISAGPSRVSAEHFFEHFFETYLCVALYV